MSDLEPGEVCLHRTVAGAQGFHLNRGLGSQRFATQCSEGGLIGNLEVLELCAHGLYHSAAHNHFHAARLRFVHEALRQLTAALLQGSCCTAPCWRPRAGSASPPPPGAAALVLADRSADLVDAAQASEAHDDDDDLMKLLRVRAGLVLGDFLHLVELSAWGATRMSMSTPSSFLSFQVHHALTRDAGPLVVCETSSAGAEKTTFLAPASRYVCTSLVVRRSWNGPWAAPCSSRPPSGSAPAAAWGASAPRPWSGSSHCSR